MSLCCRKKQIEDIYEDIESIGLEDYKIEDIPNEPVINYKNSKFQTKKELFLFKNKELINKYMRWINIETFKLLYTDNHIQCLHIKNKNTKNENKLILFSQSNFTNLGSILPFLLELSNYLKINILTYEYTNNNSEKLCNTDVTVLFCYLNKIKTISEIILMGISIGNIINMNIISSEIIKKVNKIKAFIMISPTWKFNYVSDTIKNKKIGINKVKNLFNVFFTVVNKEKINIFLIHGKQDYYVKYFLTLSFSQRIDYLTEWYPKNGTHFDIIIEYRTKLLYKIKNYINNSYTLSTFKTKNNINNKNKKVCNILNENNQLENNNIGKLPYIQSFKNNNLLYININEFEEEDNIIDNNSILNNDNNEIISFKGGDLIPSFKDNLNKNEAFLTDQDSSFFSFGNM